MQHRSLLPALILVLPTIAAPTLAVDFQDTRLLSQPAVSDHHVAFAYAGDLWLSGRDGTAVRRLTSHEGDENSPRFSPDGATLAFSAEYDGNVDVYVMPISGGAPTRLTYHPSVDVVQGFTPDGSAVLFASPRNVFTGRYLQLFTVPVGGGFPTQLAIPNGLRASYSPDGAKIAYIPIPEAFQQWKNYRGGTTSRIWIYDVRDRSVRQVPQPVGRCNDTDPVWIGGAVWFRSDRSGEFNLFSFDTANGKVDQHTRFDDFPLERLSGSHDTLIFEQAGYLHLFDPGTKTAKRLRIGVADDLDETQPRWVTGSQWFQSASLSPKGERAVFGYRGEIITLPAKKGDARNLTLTPGVFEREPSWSPDGSRIAYFSDSGGEYSLHLRAQDGSGEPKVYPLRGHGFYEQPLTSSATTSRRRDRAG